MQKLGAVSSFAKGYAGGALISAAIYDPRQTARRIIAAAMFVGSVAMLYMMWLSAAHGDDMEAIGGAALMGVILTFALTVSVSKFLTNVPFSVFKYHVRVSASIERSTSAKVWWVGLAGLFALSLIGAALSNLGLTALAVTGTVVAAVGAGFSAVGVLKQITTTALVAREDVARALGVHPDDIAVVNAGTLRAPIYAYSFPYLVEEEHVAALEANISDLLPGLEVASIDRQGAALVERGSSN